MTHYDRVAEAVAFVRAQTDIRPRVAVILGSGLGGFAEHLDHAIVIPYSEISHFPHSTVVGHVGRLVMGWVAGVPVMALQGRAHAYEGHGMEAVTFGTRVAAMLGAGVLVVTNAAGAINPELRQGDLVAISDHINLTGSNAAAGPNDPRWGERFFDMSRAYSPRLLELAVREVGSKTGVYLAVLGPSFETPAEIRAFRVLGADLVGMSTVHEVIVARHMGMEVLGLSLVTNAAAGVTGEVIDHHEVLDVGEQVQTRFTALMQAVIPKM